jgi:methylase of polypeptide subunit release factors
LFAKLGDRNDPVVTPKPTERELVALALALGAREVAGWSKEEERLAKGVRRVSDSRVDQLRDRIIAGDDPLGELFCSIRPAGERRSRGATFTPLAIASAMLDWAERFATPDRIVDPGAGSGRFALEAGRRFGCASIIGIESDALPALLARANLATAGLAERSKIVVGDYREVPLPCAGGRTLFAGNPPYVRHHQIEPEWKNWLIREANLRGLSGSQLAGLHVHFFIATAAKAAPGDYGIFITAAEWLDVNYGSLVRDLFLAELGGRSIVVIEPTAMPFPDAATTAAIVAFEIGSRPKHVYLKRVESLENLTIQGNVRAIRREQLESERRWSHLTRARQPGPRGYVELGELFRVQRGQVTGANKVWIEGPHTEGLPDSVMYRTVTKARELFRAGNVLENFSHLRRVIDLPVDLASFDESERSAIERFLSHAKRLGADQAYVASHRRAWWSVGLREPACILATYMARRPPAFVRNRARARHINIAHGLYPRQEFSEGVLGDLVEYLSRSVSLAHGRVYAGGLTKFEPREMERLLVPGPELLGPGKAAGSRPISRRTADF